MDESISYAIITSIAFFLNFVAYNAVFNFSTNFDENNNHYITMYLVLAISSITLTPILSSCMHPKYLYILGCFCFLFYIATSIIYIKPLLHFASILVGIGASFVWISAQQIIVRCANIHEIRYQLPHNSHIGYFQGILLCSYGLSYCFGNILPSLLSYNDKMSLTWIYIMLCSLCLLSPIILMNIDHKSIGQISYRRKYAHSSVAHPIYDPIHDDSSFGFNTPTIETFNYNTFVPHGPSQSYINNNNNNNNNVITMSGNTNHNNRSINHYSVTPINDEIETEIFVFNINNDTQTNGIQNNNHNRLFSYKPMLNCVYLWRDGRLQCIILLTIYWGFWLEFMWTEFPSVIENKIEKIEILVLIGFVDGILSFIIGKLSDYIHRFWLIIVSLLIQIVIYWMYYGYSPSITYSMPFFCVIAMLMGISDAIFTTSLFAIYPLFMEQEIETFCNCLFWQSLGIMIAFLLHLIGFGDTKSRMIGYFMTLFLCSIPFFVSRFAAKHAKSKWDKNRYDEDENYLNHRTATSPAYSN